MNAESSIIFIILAFSLGAILIMKKDTLPPSLKKWLAISAIFLIVFSFFIIIFSLFNLGT